MASSLRAVVSVLGPWSLVLGPWLRVPKLCLGTRSQGPRTKDTAHYSLLEHLNLDVLEVNLRPFGLQTKRALGQLAVAGADLNAVDLGGDGSVLAGDFRCIP